MRLIHTPLLLSALIVTLGIALAQPVASASASKAEPNVRVVTDFLPSRDGFAFDNPVPDPNAAPLRRLLTEQCGGMAFGAVDHFLSGEPLPPTARPTDRFVRTRSAVSIAANGWRFALWSSLPDRTSGALPGVATMTREVELQRLEAALSEGPVPLGLVRSRQLTQVRLDHQVVAYGLERQGSRLTVLVYDPAQPGCDQMRLHVDLADPDDPISERSGDFETAEWRGFFVESYTPVRPPTSS